MRHDINHTIFAIVFVQANKTWMWFTNRFWGQWWIGWWSWITWGRFSINLKRTRSLRWLERGNARPWWKLQTIIIFQWLRLISWALFKWKVHRINIRLFLKYCRMHFTPFFNGFNLHHIQIREIVWNQQMGNFPFLIERRDLLVRSYVAILEVAPKSNKFYMELFHNCVWVA